MEVLAALPALLGFAVHIGVVVALYAWGRRVAARLGGAWWRRAAMLPLVAVASEFLGVALTAVFLVRSFGALGNVDPSRKAEMLARSISNAMNATAVFGGIAAMLYLASVVAFTAGTLRARREDQARQA